MIKILFICHGNICRSPMAEFVMKELIKKKGYESQFLIESAAATREELGNPVYPPARKILQKHGIDCSNKRATLFVAEDYERYDYIIGMDQRNLSQLIRIVGSDPEKKFHMLLEYTGENRDIADPWWTGDFETTWIDVNDGCEALLEEIEKKELKL